MSGYANASPQFSYVAISLTAAACREGHITLEGTFSRRAHTSPKRKRGTVLRIPRSRFGLVCDPAACGITSRVAIANSAKPINCLLAGSVVH